MKRLLSALLFIAGTVTVAGTGNAQTMPGGGAGSCDASCGYVEDIGDPERSGYECFFGTGAMSGYNGCYMPAAGWCELELPCYSALPLTHPDGDLRLEKCDVLGILPSQADALESALAVLALGTRRAVAESVESARTVEPVSMSSAQ